MRLITHSYDTYDQAVRAVQTLERAGVPHDDITLVSGDKDRTVATTVAGDTPTGAGTGATLGTVLGGGAGLLAGLGALAIPGVGPVVAAGWLIATLTGAGVGAAAGGLLGSLTGAGMEETDARGYAEHVGRGGTMVSVRADDTMATQVEYILEHGEAPTAGTATRAAAVAPMTTATAAQRTAPVTPAVKPAVAAPMQTGQLDDKIQVVKENLVVGKREVEGGGVRVTSHVVETPVEEQVRLHEERVSIERRPVNQPLSGAAADAFRARTIEARATSEEAVVSKETRVVEEIGLRKEATDRVETVRDTVRETKVDVDQNPTRTGTTATGTTATGTTTTGPRGTTGTTRVGTTGAPEGLRDNAATRAVDDTLGTNVSGERPNQADGTPGNPPGTMASRAVDKTLGTNISGANPTGKL